MRIRATRAFRIFHRPHTGPPFRPRRVTNARSGCFLLRERAESVSIPDYRGFCDSRAAAWNPDAAIEAVRVANSPVVAIRSISVDVWHGGSITAMTTLFSCACRRLFCERMARCCRSIRCEGRRGRGKAGACGAPHQSAGQMELIENILIKQRLATEVRSRLRVICATPIQKRPDSHRSKRFLCCVCRSVR